MQFLKSIFEKFSKPKVDNYTEAKQEKKLQGIIGYLGLEDLWYSLTKEEQEALTRYEQSGLGADKNASLIKGDCNGFYCLFTDEEEEAFYRFEQGDMSDDNFTIIKNALSPSKDKIPSYILAFISNKILWAIHDKNYSLVEKLVSYIESKQLPKDYLSLWHFYWQILAEYYYKLRDIRADAIDLSINYCLKDIENYPYYIKKISKDGEGLPFIKTFYRLMIIYEKQGRYEEAIKYCEMAIKYGLEDNTKGGYKARLERLKKKLK